LAEPTICALRQAKHRPTIGKDTPWKSWHHVLFVRSGDNGYLYLDAVEEASVSGINAVDLNTTDVLWIGGNVDGRR